MKTFAFALMAAAASANILTSVQDFVANIPFSKEEARQRFGSQKRSFVTSPQHQHAVKQARRTIHTTRERLGLEPFGARAAADRGIDVRRAYADMTGFAAQILGLFQGLQYDDSGEQSMCFMAVEDALTATSNLTYVLKNMYQPWFWADGQMVTQDAIAVYSSIYLDCDVNKLFDSMTTLLSVEGASTLGARVGGAMLSSYPRWTEASDDPLVGDFETAEAFGALLKDVLNYAI